MAFHGPLRDAQRGGDVGIVEPCHDKGQYVRLAGRDAAISKLRTGQSATFIIFQTPEEGIGFPISLKGLGEGFDKLP